MDYPTPLIIGPLQLPHKQTFILLHGRGSSGPKFGPDLLETPIAPPPPLPTTPNESSPPTLTLNLTLPLAFPHARFVFPTAPLRRATIYHRARTRQWFDNWALVDPPATAREELQLDGLRETTAYLHKLLHEEIDRVPGGAGSVVLGGLSQGCAASLVATLLWEGERLGGVVGMCGWFPLAEGLLAVVGGVGGDEGVEGGWDPFARDEGGEEDAGGVVEPVVAAVDWLRDELQLESTASEDGTLVFQGIPVFLGHGVEDEIVNVVLGRRASECLGEMKREVSWKEYEGLGHWYSGDMLRDMVDFIGKETSWQAK